MKRHKIKYWKLEFMREHFVVLYFLVVSWSNGVRVCGGDLLYTYKDFDTGLYCVHVYIKAMCVCYPHRCRVVLVPSGADHPAQNFQSVYGDVSRCVDGFLAHHLAVDHHFGARLADCNVKLRETKHPTCSLHIAPSDLFLVHLVT